MFRVKIKSHIKENEEFDFRSTPKQFASVTEKSIRELHDNSLLDIRRRYKNKWTPNALKSMLQSVAGQFNIAHARLEADYTTRLSSLENAYSAGLADINAQIINFGAEVEEHNRLFDEYAAAYEKIMGEKPNSALRYPQSKLDKIEKDYKKLQEEF